MSRRCDLTGRGPQVGHKVSHAHNLSKKRWNINLQKVRVIIDGRVQRIRVSTKAIKSGLIEKPPLKIRERKAKIERPQVVAAAATVPDEQIPHFFSSQTVVHRLFKPKKKAGAADEDIMVVPAAPAVVVEAAKPEQSAEPSPEATERLKKAGDASTNEDVPPFQVYEENQPAPDDDDNPPE